MSRVVVVNWHHINYPEPPGRHDENLLAPMSSSGRRASVAVVACWPRCPSGFRLPHYRGTLAAWATAAR